MAKTRRRDRKAYDWWYRQSNLEELREKARQYQKNKRRARLVIVNEFKNRPCEDCGNRFPPECMDFDHRAGTEKLFGIGTKLLHHSIDEILAEISKCDVVCANCHRIRTKRGWAEGTIKRKRTKADISIGTSTWDEGTKRGVDVPELRISGPGQEELHSEGFYQVERLSPDSRSN